MAEGVMIWRKSAATAVAAVALAASPESKAFAQGGSISYSYDALGRVVDASYPDGTCLAYTYDAAGNRTQYTVSTAPGIVAPARAVTTYEAVAISFDPRLGNPTCGTLTVHAVGTPSHGTASIVTGGTGITYTPASGYTGSDSFTYQVSSGGTTSPNGTVTVTVLAPTLGPSALPGSGSYTGPNLPPHTMPPIVVDVTSLVSSPYGYAPTITAVTNGTHGTVTSVGNQVIYTFNGGGQDKDYSDSCTYTVSDGYGHTATATISLMISIVSD